MGGQQLLESQGAKKTRMENSSQAPVPGTQFCLYLWDIFSFFFSSLFFKDSEKIQTTDCMTAGIFFNCIFPFWLQGDGICSSASKGM